VTQKGILAEETRYARYLFFSIEMTTDITRALIALRDVNNSDLTVIGLGESLVTCFSKDIPGLKVFPADASFAIDVPSTPAALWCWLRGDDRGELFHRSRQIEALLAPALVLSEVVESFQYDRNRDLSGYIDGTENPVGDEAQQAAIVTGQGTGLDGGSFVAVQQWLHDFDSLSDMSIEEKDDVIGRHISDNEEFDSAPESAHVKRTAQESFTPDAFILRRSMPWVEGMDGGLMFVAFGKDFTAFEALHNRMLGKEDGVRDGIYQFTRPISGGYYFCPPVKAGKLDLSCIGL